MLEWEESASHEEASIKFTARNEGFREGLEAGLKNGKQDGIKEIAKKMKSQGYNIETIIELTGLKREIIEGL